MVQLRNPIYGDETVLPKKNYAEQQTMNSPARGFDWSDAAVLDTMMLLGLMVALCIRLWRRSWE